MRSILLVLASAACATAALAAAPVRSVADLVRAPEAVGFDSQINRGLDALGRHRRFKFAEVLELGAFSVDAKTKAFADGGGKWTIATTPSVGLVAQTSAEHALVCEPDHRPEGFALSDRQTISRSDGDTETCLAIHPSDQGR
jgi:hypothetical protein